MDCFLYDTDLHHEGVNELNLAYNLLFKLLLELIFITRLLVRHFDYAK